MKSSWPALMGLGLALLAGPAGALGMSPEGAPAPTRPALVEKAFTELSDVRLSAHGAKALGFRPERWRHAETEHFILHFRNLAEAQRVGQEIEYHLDFVARALAAAPERYARKSHVFIFADAKEWSDFKLVAGIYPWAGSMAAGEDLFLNLGGGPNGEFDARTLAHETTHAIVARLFPQRRWPLWLSEGFAEVMARRSSQTRAGRDPAVTPLLRSMPEYPLIGLTRIEAYPTSPDEVVRFYRSAEKLIRFLFEQHPPARFPELVDSLLETRDLAASVLKVYGSIYRSFGEFELAFAHYQSSRR